MAEIQEDKALKKTYVRPEIEITSFTTEDIITASSPSTGMTNGGSLNADTNTEINIDLGGGTWVNPRV